MWPTITSQNILYTLLAYLHRAIIYHQTRHCVRVQTHRFIRIEGLDYAATSYKHAMPIPADIDRSNRTQAPDPPTPHPTSCYILRGKSVSSASLNSSSASSSTPAGSSNYGATAWWSSRAVKRFGRCFRMLFDEIKGISWGIVSKLALRKSCISALLLSMRLFRLVRSRSPALNLVQSTRRRLGDRLYAAPRCLAGNPSP